MKSGAARGTLVKAVQRIYKDGGGSDDPEIVVQGIQTTYEMAIRMCVKRCEKVQSFLTYLSYLQMSEAELVDISFVKQILAPEVHRILGALSNTEALQHIIAVARSIALFKRVCRFRDFHVD